MLIVSRLDWVNVTTIMSEIFVLSGKIILKVLVAFMKYVFVAVVSI